MVFLTFAVVLQSNGCLSVELFLRVPSFSYLRHSPVLWAMCAPCAPMFLAQRAAFLEPHLFRDTVVCGTTTLALTFLALSAVPNGYTELSLVGEFDFVRKIFSLRDGFLDLVYHRYVGAVSYTHLTLPTKA